MVRSVNALKCKPSRLAQLLAATAIVLFAAGCGSSGDEKTVTEQRTVTEGAATTASGSEASGQGPTASAASLRPLPLKSFGTPSGNIGCRLATTYARCDIKAHDWTAPPKPANCDVDWGGGLTLSEKRASVLCAGDTAFDLTAPVLAYGARARRGAIICISREAGMTCKAPRTGHGFFLSRQTYRLF